MKWWRRTDLNLEGTGPFKVRVQADAEENTVTITVTQGEDFAEFTVFASEAEAIVAAIDGRLKYIRHKRRLRLVQ